MRSDFVYTGIRVKDLEASLRFYSDALGMEVHLRMRIPETCGEIAVLRTAGGRQRLELNRYADDSPVAGPYREGSELDHLAFRVRDLRRALEELQARGHPVVHGPITSKNVTWAYVEDPNGIWIELFEERRGSQRRRTRPGRAPVGRPRRATTSPLTRTQSRPRAGRLGLP